MGVDQASRMVLGIDYGTDSCRGVIVDAGADCPAEKRETASFTAPYPRWAKGLYCDPSANRFRQHPLDYTESLTAVMDGLQKFNERGGL